MFGQKQDRIKILAYHGIADDLYKVNLVDDCFEKFENKIRVKGRIDFQYLREKDQTHEVAP
jgi:hypothetical protein